MDTAKTISNLRILRLKFKPFPRKRRFRLTIDGAGEMIPAYDLEKHFDAKHPIFVIAQIDDARMREILNACLEIYTVKENKQ